MLCICYITLNFSKTLSSTSGQISRDILIAVGSGTILMISERGIHILSSFFPHPSHQFICFTIPCRWVFFLLRRLRDFFSKRLTLSLEFSFSFSSFLMFLYSRSSLRRFRFREASPLFGNGIDTSIGDGDIV